MEKSELPCGVILSIIGVGLFVTVFLVNYPDESSGAWAAWAAWVQAFGSIGAIMAAYFLGERQAARAEKLQLEMARKIVEQRRAAFYAIAESTWDLAAEIDRIFTPNPTWMDIHSYHYDESMIDGLMSALRGVPVHEIGSATAVREFLALHENLAELKNCAKSWFTTRYNTALEAEARNNFLAISKNDVMGSVIQKIKERVGKIHAAMYPDSEVVVVAVRAEA